MFEKVSAVAAVVCAGEHGMNALATVRSLGRRGVRVHVLETVHGLRLASASRYCTSCTQVTDLALVYPALRAIGKAAGSQSGSRPVLFIDNDSMLRQLSPHAAELEQFFRLVDPVGGALQLTDKAFQMRAARQAGIPVPVTWFPQCASDLLEIGRATSRRVIAKPVPGAKVPFKAVIAAGTELAGKLAAHGVHPSRVIVQEYIEGEDSAVYAGFCYRSPTGRHSQVLTVRKLRQFPAGAGVMAVGEIFDAPEVREMTERLAGALSYRGILSTEFKRDRDGTYYFIEWNPRLAGFHALGWKARFDCAYAAYWDLMVPEAAPWPTLPDYAARHVWINVQCELLTLARAPRLALRPGQWQPYFRPKEWAVFAWDDLAPWIRAAAQTARWFARGLWRAGFARKAVA